MAGGDSGGDHFLLDGRPIRSGGAEAEQGHEKLCPVIEPENESTCLVEAEQLEPTTGLVESVEGLFEPPAVKLFEDLCQAPCDKVFDLIFDAADDQAFACVAKAASIDHVASKAEQPEFVFIKSPAGHTAAQQPELDGPALAAPIVPCHNQECAEAEHEHATFNSGTASAVHESG